MWSSRTYNVIIDPAISSYPDGYKEPINFNFVNCYVLGGGRSVSSGIL